MCFRAIKKTTVWVRVRATPKSFSCRRAAGQLPASSRLLFDPLWIGLPSDQKGAMENLSLRVDLPSGKPTKNYGKSQLLMGKSTINGSCSIVM